MDRYGLIEWGKNTNLHSYNCALFKNMMFFVDVVWEINMVTKTVIVLEDRIHNMNNGMEYAFDDVYNEYMNDYIFEKDKDKVSQYFRFDALLKLKEQTSLNAHIKTSRGTLVYYQIVITPAFDEKGQLACVYLSARNMQQEAELLRETMACEEFVMQQISSINNTRSLEQSIHLLLKSLGEFTHADRAYIFDIKEDGTFINTYEWCIRDHHSQIGNLGEIPPESVSCWLSEFKKGNHVFVYDLENCKDIMPEEYKILKPQGIKSLAAAPIVVREKLCACIGVDNPDVNIIHLTSHLLSVLGNYAGRVIMDYRYTQNEIQHMRDKENMERYKLLASMSRVYCCLYQVDLGTHTYTEINSTDDVRAYLQYHGDVFEGFKLWAQNEAKDAYREALGDFFNLDILKERMVNDELLSIQFETEQHGWCEAGFFIVDRDDKGQPLRLLWTVKDIDKMKTKEIKANIALTEAYDAANRANAAKTTFLSSMSHDIRTPMNAIIGMTAIARAHLDDRKRVKDCLDKITISSRHLLGLINEVLDMSRIESGRIELAEETFNLAELLDNVMTMVHPLVDSKRHDLKVNIHDVEHENVIGDSMRIQQIFTNIVSNAVKYTPEHGKLRIDITEKSSGDPKLGLYEFVFEDNGIGMSEEFLPHVFDAFTRANTQAMPKLQGTGLGMAITKNIVNMMDGDIQVESYLGLGTKFIVTIYLKLQQTEKLSYEHFKGLDILVVDDDKTTCESISLLLKELGMDSEWVTSGYCAIEKIQQRHDAGNDYYAVMVDWKMPDMGGLETIKEIREKIDTNIHTIIISSYDWSEIEQAARARGVTAFISKPVFKSRLVRTFGELLGTNRKMDETKGLNEIAVEHDFGGKRILLAEDNEMNAKIAMDILQMVNLKSEWAQNGKEAVDMMAESEPGYYDCVLMDIQMPVMNGNDAARAIRSLNHTDAKTIPIFALTANAFVEDIQASRGAGMNEHIAKPLDIGKLLDTLKRYLK